MWTSRILKRLSPLACRIISATRVSFCGRSGIDIWFGCDSGGPGSVRSPPFSIGVMNLTARPQMTLHLIWQGLKLCCHNHVAELVHVSRGTGTNWSDPL